MFRSLHSIFLPFRSKYLCTSLLILWFGGLLFGAYSATYAVPFVSSSIHSDQLSVLELVLVRLLPVWVMLLALYLSNTSLLMLLFLFKAFFFAFASATIALSLTSSAGLIIFLMLFSEIFSLPVLWLIFISSDGRFFLRRSVLFIAIVLIVTALDSVCIVPFLRRLLII